MSEGQDATAAQLARGASVAAAGSVYQQAVAFASGLLVARVIGAGDYGIFNLARNLVDVTGVVTRLGLEIGLQRYFGETVTVDQQQRRAAVLARLRLLAVGVALVPGIALALGLGRALEGGVYRHAGFGDLLLGLALTLPFVTDLAVLGGAYRGLLRLAPAVLADSVLLPTIRLATMAGLFLAGYRLWAVVAGTMLASLLASTFLAHRARLDFGASERAGVSIWPEALRVVRYSSVLAAAVLVTTLTATMDMLFLGRFGSAEDLGRYSLIKTLLLLMGLVGGAFNQTLGASVAARYSLGDRPGVVRVMSLTVRWIALGTVPMFAIFVFWGSSLVALFGASFVVSPAVVGVLATGQFIAVVFGPAGWALSMTGKHFLELGILVLGAIVAAASCALAVPIFGQLGAALATCASVGLTNLARVLIVRRRLGSLPFDHDVGLIGAVGLGLAAVSQGLVAQWSLPIVWHGVVGATCFVALYGAAVWTCLLNEVEKSAARTALAAAHVLLRQPSRT